MIRVTIYLKSGAVAEFDAQAVVDTSAESHPKFRLDFPPSEEGGRRLAYLDRDDVSAVVVEDAGDAPSVLKEAAAVIAAPAEREVTETEAMTVSVGGLSAVGGA